MPFNQSNHKHTQSHAVKKESSFNQWIMYKHWTYLMKWLSIFFFRIDNTTTMANTMVNALHTSITYTTDVFRQFNE